jgi:signal-transduction protein with cAMP-binding, CBS, and nucleotidyltransferase domain
MNFKPVFETKNTEAEYELIMKYMVPLNNMITNRHMVGIISEKDCLRVIVDQAYHNLPANSRKVSDYMTVNVKTLSPKTNVVEAAIEFLNSSVRRFPVVENGTLIGQVSRRDILRAAQSIKATTW